MADGESNPDGEHRGHQDTESQASTDTRSAESESPEAASTASAEASEESRDQSGPDTDDVDQRGDSPSAEENETTDHESETEAAGEATTGGPSETVDTAAEIRSLRDSVARTQDQIADLETRLEDHKRRNEHEHEELRKYTVEEFASEMLKVKDMLGDAIELEEFTEDTEHRLRMIEKQFDNVLTSGRVERIEPDPSEKFDDRLHQMMGKVSTEEYDSEEIVRVLEVGYRAHDRVIRPARVEVATNQPD